MGSRGALANRLISKVAITCGTHGNERAGVVLCQELQRQPLRRSSCDIRCVLSNPAAAKADRRYVDTDLNRCFGLADLDPARPAQPTLEARRARELDAELGPKRSAEPATDFILDLHNTTANTGTLLCFHPDDEFAHELAAQLHRLDPSVRAARWPTGDQPFLPTVARSGMTVEIGPVPHSTVNAELTRHTLQLLHSACDYIERRNVDLAARQAAGGSFEGSAERQSETVALPVARRLATIDYPRGSDGEYGGATPSPSAFVHPSLQGVAELQDGSTISAGDPLFLKLDGSTLQFEPAEYGITAEQEAAGLYPFFVNEAAYYEKSIAMVLAARDTVQVQVLA